MIISVCLCAYIVVGGFLHIRSGIFKHVDDGIRIDGQISIWLSRAQGEMFMTKKWLSQMFPFLRAADMLSWLMISLKKASALTLTQQSALSFTFQYI